MEDIVFALIEKDEELKKIFRIQVIKVISNEKFAKAIEKNILKTIENLELDDLLYDLINNEDMLKPLIISIRNKLQKVLA